MKILFIQTGGTIDKDYPKSIGGYAFEITSPAFLRILEKANPGFDFEYECLFRKDSLEIDDADREKLLILCQNTPHRNIIITHGTDTMIQTGRYLREIHNKTIIITGSMKPERFKDTDASFNLGMAVGAIIHAVPGVHIAIQGTVSPIDSIMRDPQSGTFLTK